MVHAEMIFRLFGIFIGLCSTDGFSNPTSRLSVNTAPSRAGAKLFSTVAKTLPDGISKTVTVQGTGRDVRLGDMVIVKYVCKAEGVDTAFARADRQRFVPGDGTMVPGWDLAVRTMREGERATVIVTDPKYGYGSAGVPPFVPPNAKLEFDIEVLDIEDSAGFMAGDSSDLIAMDGPINRPRTPGAIAAAYEQKMKEKAMNAPEEKEGIAWAIDKVKSSYFFGLFEGETGQEAPWYLKPSITFPLAFLVVGIAFYVSLAGGAISERGMPSTDELDEIIIASNTIQAAVILALNL
ncbi:hypothetical protein ACHAWX_001841 [Stephanocyclus meneghinianus]